MRHALLCHCSPPPPPPFNIFQSLDLGNGSVVSSRACPCGYVTSFDVGSITLSGLTYVTTLGFQCRRVDSACISACVHACVWC